MNDVETRFDRWYAALVTSSRREELLERHLGLPPLLLVTGLVPWQGLDSVCTSLRLVPGEVLLDLGCGRGGYGLEVSRRTQAQLVGVDVSTQALRQAEANAETRDQSATFRHGDLADTGLEDRSVDAVMCLDSVQFSLRTLNTYAEVRRVLRPGGRVVVTAWEARDRDDESVEEHWRTLDVALGLERAGFEEVSREVCDDWSAAERGLWEEVTAVADAPGGAGSDAGLAGLVQEAGRVWPTFDRLDRVMVTATAPS